MSEIVVCFLFSFCSSVKYNSIAKTFEITFRVRNDVIVMFTHSKVTHLAIELALG